MEIMCNQKTYKTAAELWLEKHRVKVIPLITMQDFENVISEGVVNRALLIRLNNKLADACHHEYSRGYATAIEHLDI